MADFVQIEVDAGVSKKWILLQKDAKIDKVFSTVAKEFSIYFQPYNNILLYNQGRCLTFSHDKSIGDFGLTHLSKLELQVPLAGGIWPLNAIKARKTNLQPLPGYIRVTTSSTEPDMITLEANASEKRARMPCGHIIGPSSMTSYCQSLLSEGKFKFVCPSVDSKSGKSNCESQWEYFLVRHVACLNDEESQEFEKKISENYLKKAKGFQLCPSCAVWCYKDPGMKNYVRCPMCKIDFCWACLRGWTASSGSRMCGNPDCNGKDNREKILANCSTKVIYNCQACPTIRACPKCLLLTEHREKCGHMICPGCQHGFCFICLEGKKSNGEWSCPPVGKCPLAPRQISNYV